MLLFIRPTKILSVCLVLMSHFKGAHSKDCHKHVLLDAATDITASFDKRDYPALTWISPYKDNVVICNLTAACNSFTSAYYRAVINGVNGTSTLTIKNVQLRDVGVWRITNSSVYEPVCALSAAGIPSCSIESDVDTKVVDIGSEVTLTISLTQYYCTRSLSVNLTTGNITDEILAEGNMTEVLNHTSTLTFNVTSDHFGGMGLIFLCDGVQTHLNCDGVREVFERTTTTEATTQTVTTTVQTTVPLETTHTESTSTFKTMSASTKEPKIGDDHGNENSADLGLIFGIVAGCVVLITAILIFFFWEHLKTTYQKYSVTGRKYGHQTPTTETYVRSSTVEPDAYTN